MKKLLIITSILCGSVLPSWSQIHFDVKLGVSPGSNPLTPHLIVNRSNPHEEFLFNMVNVKPQFYGGIALNLPLGRPFFAEGGISYTKRTSSYMVRYRMARENSPQTEYMQESEEMILLPINIGVSIGSLDITSGLTAARTISTAKELTHLKGFHQDENKFKLGWQMGVRYAVGRAMAGVEYQGSFNRVGQGMYVNGQSLEIMNVPGKLVFSVQYRF